MSLQLTEAGRMFLDLWENQWMTRETHSLSQTGSMFTVRAFHGDYELRVRYQGKELSNMTQIFTLGKSSHQIDINISL